jgi:hypothetical protein
MESKNLGTGPMPPLFFPSSTSPFAPLPPVASPPKPPTPGNQDGVVADKEGSEASGIAVEPELEKQTPHRKP